MPRKHGNKGRGPKARSAEQRLGNAALTYVMQAWEELTDEERLTWRVQSKDHRSNGINYFKKINLRRARRGEELARVPPPSKAYDGRRVVKRLHIRNRGGLITLSLELYRTPTAPTTVWGARPCNRGVEKPSKCPRLGWLPAPEDEASDITELYFQKHGEHIKKHRMQLAGKRIFIRIRREVDDGDDLYEEVNALVP
jgi:hypothetical protein